MSVAILAQETPSQCFLGVAVWVGSSQGSPPSILLHQAYFLPFLLFALRLPELFIIYFFAAVHCSIIEHLGVLTPCLECRRLAQVRAQDSGLAPNHSLV